MTFGQDCRINSTVTNKANFAPPKINKKNNFSNGICNFLKEYLNFFNILFLFLTNLYLKA